MQARNKKSAETPSAAPQPKAQDKPAKGCDDGDKVVQPFSQQTQRPQ